MFIIISNFRRYDKEETFVVITKLQKPFFTMVYSLSNYVLQLLSR